MRVHVIQHVPFESTGSIGSWLSRHEAEVTSTRLFEGNVFERPEGLSLLIVMGGPMSVHDEAEFSWLRSERTFIRDTIERGIPTLGICLGAQLIACALGAPVYRNSDKEIGWFPVTATVPSRDTFRLPARCEVFHWHGETFDLPDGAVLLARSEACRNQAFQIGEHVIGLQFHLEMTPESIRGMVENCRNELIPGKYIQSEQQLLRTDTAVYASVNSLMDSLLTYLVKR